MTVRKDGPRIIAQTYQLARMGRVVHAYHADPIGGGDQTRPCW